jgi:hypothetical protein
MISGETMKKQKDIPSLKDSQGRQQRTSSISINDISRLVHQSYLHYLRANPDIWSWDGLWALEKEDTSS